MTMSVAREAQFYNPAPPSRWYRPWSAGSQQAASEIALGSWCEVCREVVGAGHCCETSSPQTGMYGQIVNPPLRRAEVERNAEAGSHRWWGGHRAVNAARSEIRSAVMR